MRPKGAQTTSNWHISTNCWQYVSNTKCQNVHSPTQYQSIDTGSSRKNVKSNKIANINFFRVWAFLTPCCWPQPPTNLVQCNNNAHLIKKMWFQSYTMAPLQMARPPTSEAFLGHLSLWNEVWNVSRMKGLALTFPKMLWKSRIGPKMTELESVENYQLSQIRAAEALTSGLAPCCCRRC